MTSPDPQWTVEFSVYDNITKAKRSVFIDAPELPDAVAGAVAGIQAVFGSELKRGIERIWPEHDDAPGAQSA